MKQVRAKFIVTEKAFYSGSGKLVLFSVTSGSPENDEFFKWTPGGQIELHVVSHETLNLFGIDDEFYVDFTPADSK